VALERADFTREWWPSRRASSAGACDSLTRLLDRVDVAESASSMVGDLRRFGRDLH